MENGKWKIKTKIEKWLKYVMNTGMFSTSSRKLF